MTTQNTLAILSLILASISILGMAYGFGVMFQDLRTKVSLLWEINVQEALKNAQAKGWLHSESRAIPTAWADVQIQAGTDQDVIAVLKGLAQRPIPDRDDQLMAMIHKALGNEVVLRRSKFWNNTVAEYLVFVCALVRKYREDYVAVLQKGGD